MPRLLCLMWAACYIVFCGMASQAACIDVVDLSVELPAQVSTPANTIISFDYDLVDDQYSLSLHKGSSESERFGPFPLTMSCGTATVRWESDDFLLLERACGTFCWYAKIFYLADTPAPNVASYQRIERPLAFDGNTDRLAYYHSQNLIRVRNLRTGDEQEIRTKYDCEYYSGLCFGDVQITGQQLQYSWVSDQNGERISVVLDVE